MTLPDFITKALAFFQKAEANLTAEQELAKAQTRIVELEASVASFNGLDVKVKDLEQAAVKATETISARDAEIAKLKAAVEAEKTKATDTLAGLGVDPKTIPAPKGEAKPEGGTGIVDQYKAITDGTERVAFYRKNKDAIDAAWGK